MYDLWPLIYGVFAISGSIVPLVPQYMDLQQKKVKRGSLSVSMTAILANGLYIIYMFWTGRIEKFHLLHNILVIYAHFTIIGKTVKVMREEGFFPREHNIFDFEPEYFLQWTNTLSYVYFASLCFMGVIVFILSVPFPFPIEILASISVWTEALETLPQILENFQHGFVKESLNEFTLEMWIGGDLMKAFMNYSSGYKSFVPQLVSVITDGVLLGQQYLEKLRIEPRPRRRSEDRRAAS